MRIIELGNPDDTRPIHRSGGLSTPTKYEQPRDNTAAIAAAGRKAWSLLHRYRGCDPVFFEAWQAWIPRGCACKEDFTKILADYPPDFSTPEAFFNWGVFMHNLVNEKLGNPIMEHAEAKALWHKEKACGCDEAEERCNRACDQQ